jgi:hypothetical protein
MNKDRIQLERSRREDDKMGRQIGPSDIAGGAAAHSKHYANTGDILSRASEPRVAPASMPVPTPPSTAGGFELPPEGFDVKYEHHTQPHAARTDHSTLRTPEMINESRRLQHEEDERTKIGWGRENATGNTSRNRSESRLHSVAGRAARAGVAGLAAHEAAKRRDREEKRQVPSESHELSFAVFYSPSLSNVLHSTDPR